MNLLPDESVNSRRFKVEINEVRRDKRLNCHMFKSSDNVNIDNLSNVKNIIL